MGRLCSICALYFLVMIAWSLGRSASVSYFLKDAGPEKLPYMYLINSVLIVFISPLYSRIVDRIARYNLFNAQLIIYAFFIAFLRFLSSVHFPWISYVIFSLAEISFLMITMHFWTYANDLFDPREGKRCFPLIGGVGLLGMVVGGLLAKPVVALIGTTNIFILWSLILLISIPFTLWVHKEEVLSLKRSGDENPIKEGMKESNFRESVRSLWKIPLIRTLTFLSVPMWLVVYFVDFQFFLAINEVFKNQDKLTGFLGMFNSITSLVGFLIQIFLTGKLLQKFGIGLSLLSHPFSMSIGSLGLVIRSLLPNPLSSSFFSFRNFSAVFAKFSDNAIYYSIRESASHLLFNAIPEEKRGQARAFVSGIVENSCIALAGIILILFEKAHTPPYIISFSTLGLSVLWIVYTLKVKSDYFSALVENLSAHSVEMRISAMREVSKMKQSKVFNTFLESISSSQESVALFSFQMLKNMNDPTMIDKICQRLDKVLPNVKVAILSLLIEMKSKGKISMISNLTEDAAPEVRAAAIKALGALGGIGALPHLDHFLKDPSIDVCSETIVAIVKNKVGLNLKVQAIEKLRNFTKETQTSIQAKAAYIIGEIGFKLLISTLMNIAHATDENVQYEVFRAIGKIGDQKVVPRLVRFLEVEQSMQYAEDAIVSMGEVVLEALHRDLNSDENNMDLKVNIIRCLKRLRHPKSLPILLNLMKGEPNKVQDAVLDALAHIKTKEPKHLKELISLSTVVSNYLNSIVEKMKKENTHVVQLQNLENKNSKAIYLLTDALNRMGQKREEAALKCVELLSDSSVIQTIAVDLRSSNPRTQAEAIEILEESCPEAKTLAAILEDKYIRKPQEGSSITISELLNELWLEKNVPVWLNACMAYTLGELKITDQKNKLLELLEGRDSLIVLNAALALHKMNIRFDLVLNQEEIKMMDLKMERILFLRTVPLFAEMDPDILQWIGEIAVEKDIPSGQVIFNENDEADALYIILNGMVKIFKDAKNQANLDILMDKDYFGEIALIDGGKRSASVMALKDTRVLAINRDSFERLLMARPKITYALLKSLSKRLREINRNFTNVSAWMK